MTQFQVVVPRLNKRKFPVEDTADKSNILGEVNPGFQFESVSEITNSLGKWYQDRDGSFYWGGGVAEKKQTDTLKIISVSGPNAAWINNLKLPEVWKISTGKKVNVAILDSGINLLNKEITDNVFQYDESNPVLNDARVCKNFLNGSSDVSDLFWHGSHCASLISSRNNSDKIGVAPDAKLFIGKISVQGGLRDFSVLTKGINWASSIEEVDIISISYGLSKEDSTFNDFQKAIQNAINKNKIIVASIGDKDNTPLPLYPAIFTDCISVGATDSLGNYWLGNTKFDDTIIHAPGVDIFSHVVKSMDYPNGDKQICPASGNSQSTAIVAGIIALLLSYFKEKEIAYSPTEIKKLIRKFGKPILNIEQKILIDPISIINNI